MLEKRRTLYPDIKKKGYDWDIKRNKWSLWSELIVIPHLFKDVWIENSRMKGMYHGQALSPYSQYSI